MKRLTNSRLILAFLFLTVTGPVCAGQDVLPEVTVDGLHRVPNSKMAVVYAEPGADLARYNRILMLEPYVAFKKNWERDQRSSSANPLRITSKDIEEIKSRLAGEFQSVFSTSLEEAGYQLTDETGEDVLLVRPAIINLEVNAPDSPRAGRTKTYASSAGEMTLYIELYDSVTGDMIAKALDRQADNQAFYTWSNPVTNKKAADKILQGWANTLVEALDAARQP